MSNHSFEKEVQVLTLSPRVTVCLVVIQALCDAVCAGSQSAISRYCPIYSYSHTPIMSNRTYISGKA